MAQTEEEALDELLSQDTNPTWSRWAAWIASIVTLGVVVTLMFVTMRQIAQTDRDAYEAHRREVRVQRALDSARQLQSISAEQFLSFGTSRGQAPACTAETVDSPACVALAQSVLADFIQGTFLGSDGLRQLRVVAGHPDAPEDLRDIAAFVRDANSLERWVAPMAESVDVLRADQLFRSVSERIPEGGTGPWPLVRARLDGIALAVGGANSDTCGACSELLWGDQPGSSDEATPAFIDPSDSFELAVWQAECLRKLPTLSDPAFAGCSNSARDTSREAKLARDKGRQLSEDQFRAATTWFESQALPDDHKVCGVLASASGEPAGRRTIATTAGRAYNGLAMSLINHPKVSTLTLEEAKQAIERAVCFRAEAQQTPSQIAGSGENLAVIAYRDALQALEEGQEEAAREAFNEAKCRAEAAVTDNVNLPWSWTILYLTHTARPSVFEGLETCGDITGRPESEVGGHGRTSTRLWRQLSFFTPGSFAPEELPGLLPMFPNGPFNRTGYTDLGDMLTDLDEAHDNLAGSEDDLLQVFMSSLVSPNGSVGIPFLGR